MEARQSRRLWCRSRADGWGAEAPRQLDPNDAFVGDRLVAYTLHFLGDQAGAACCCRARTCHSDLVCGLHRADLCC